MSAGAHFCDMLHVAPGRSKREVSLARTWQWSNHEMVIFVENVSTRVALAVAAV